MEYIQELRAHVGTRPLIIVGSTVLVFDEEQRILFQLRSDTLEWGLPGGAMEPGESLEETAGRELREETGLGAESFEALGILSGEDLYFQYPNGDEVYNVIAIFKAQRVHGSLRSQDDESEDLQYFSVHDLPSPLDERAEMVIKEAIQCSELWC
ncbi:NUDIX hydrolase [Halobacillus litoralis]|uniref:NUDIX hydrolase n=1 Tax=Halobacillus litoralis TaxID=45668 RepID=UPI001CD54245|nr:NUDIX hydrolase [Halobacillus litoralis]MCA0972414.1 NUDIX hydrolase [Halobacillus litoralis]